MQNRSSFTLIELLIVIGILSVLVAAVVIALNPAQLLAQARDSKRLTDSAAVNKAMEIVQAIQPPVSLGTASTVYVSVPDTSPTCTNLGLPALPSGWVYNCVSSSNLQKSDGSGWIPINFNIAGGALLPVLPTDPVNATSGGAFYVYVPHDAGVWEVSMPLESVKYVTKAAADGGTNTARYESGTNLVLLQETFLGVAPVAPTVETESVDVYAGYSSIGAEMFGSVHPHNTQTAYWFDYGTTESFGLSTPHETVTGDATSSISIFIEGLAPLTGYYFRLSAQNEVGTVHGSALYFSTPSLVKPPAA